ncbi:MAG: glycosyltransferase family 4 protein [Candidatus Acidiferrales bacterium]
MSSAARKRRVAVVSPFLDKRHGTERMVVEWIARLSADFEFHIYSQRVRDIDVSQIVVHRVPKLPGPHLFNFVWWFVANHFQRFWDRRVRGLSCDLVFSPGVNCLDADAVSIHIIFAELLRRVAPELKLRKNPARSWPLLIHRRIYYRLIGALEKRVFTNPRTQLILTSPRTAAELARFYSRRERLPMVCAGVDHAAFNPARRAALRAAARAELHIADSEFVLLLIGNDWRKKGLAVLLNALAQTPDVPLRLLVVTHEASIEQEVFSALPIDRRVHFLRPRADVEFYFAAADIYTGPSLEDTFALPASEAMACGLPAIVSSRAGVSEFITNGVDGLILDDPTDAAALASMIRRLYEDGDLRDRLGAKASETARQFSWERNARELAAIFEEIIRRKSDMQAQTLTQES